MKQLSRLSVPAIALVAIPAAAAIINIPIDYSTVQSGIDAAANSDTVLIQPGIYYENIFLEEHTVILASLALTTGDTTYVDRTIIDGNLSGPVITLYYQNDFAKGYSTIFGFTIRGGHGDRGGGISCRSSDPVISHNHIINNLSNDYGGGIFIWTDSNPVISDNIISDNTAVDGGGGVCICWSRAKLFHNLILNNFAPIGGGVLLTSNTGIPVVEFSDDLIADNKASIYCGGVVAYDSQFKILNTTIAGNIVHNQFASGLYMEDCLAVSITNTIIWNNHLVAHNSLYTLSYSDTEEDIPGAGNINEDPLFCGPESADYYLQENSPCVGSGENGADMGMFGVGCEANDVPENSNGLPLWCRLEQNQPNPFNTATTIYYTITRETHVSLDIYDLLGRHVSCMVDQIQPAGAYSAIWQPRDQPSGVYFARLSTAGSDRNIKLILLK
jgi:parallel beta-helix repeat protein